MESIEVDYNRNLKPLETVLSGVKRQGDFFVSGATEMPMPKVDIDGVGTLSFPLPQAQIAALVRQAERAPYGRGDKTVIDTSVRKVWQIASGKVRITGKSWAANFETILSTVRVGLGCEGVTRILRSTAVLSSRPELPGGHRAEGHRLRVRISPFSPFAHQRKMPRDQMFGSAILFAQQR